MNLTKFVLVSLCSFHIHFYNCARAYVRLWVGEKERGRLGGYFRKIHLLKRLKMFACQSVTTNYRLGKMGNIYQEEQVHYTKVFTVVVVT